MIEQFVLLLRKGMGLTRFQKRMMVIGLDAFLCMAAVWIAFSLRLGDWTLWSDPIKIFSITAMLLWLPIFYLGGVYKTIFRFAGAGTILTIAKAVVGLSIPLIILYGFVTFSGVPRTVAVIHPIIFFGLLAISRIVMRYLLVDIVNAHHFEGQYRNVLIYGAGAVGKQLAASLATEPSMNLVGFIDDNPNIAGQKLNGKPVFFSSDLETLIAKNQISDVILAFPNAPRIVQQSVIERLSELKIKVQKLPSLSMLIEGSITVSDLKPISIEDLLGRMAIEPDNILMTGAVAGKTVVVTGAGGSIGSELCAQILAYNPVRIILAEISEASLYQVDQTLRDIQKQLGNLDTDIVAELVNVVERSQVSRLLAKWKPDIVFHSAAYKHVPLIEANPLSGIKNNIYGTLNLVFEAEAAGIKKFILISTDKAVRPTNIMGATKRVCELILQAMAARGSETKFSMVRFGNVLGSSGSVVPRFVAQIEKGGPVTLTDQRITRYFMTIPEAAQLVTQAAGMADGGEVFLLDMGEPVRIADLARTMIHLSGRSLRHDENPNGDIEIVEIGLRPGEKLYEELLIGSNSKPSSHPKILTATENHLDWTALEEHLDILNARIVAGDIQGSISILKNIVPEFNHSESD
ncbi:MAG: polysaccharide biosynthesis protein [Sphingomonadales bacterium]|nr:polysaccharide biosynthesis protein [Sphingomonadales bacterium]